MATTTSAKRSGDGNSPKSKRAPHLRVLCAFQNAGCCGDVRRCVVRHTAQDDHDSYALMLCDGHRTCITCGAFVKDNEFSEIDGVGVACHRPDLDDRVEEQGCAFFCGGCLTVRVIAQLNREWDDEEDEDTSLRCLCCTGKCVRCGQQREGGFYNPDSNWVCLGCQQDGDSRDDDDDSSHEYDDVYILTMVEEDSGWRTRCVEARYLSCVVRAELERIQSSASRLSWSKNATLHELGVALGWLFADSDDEKAPSDEQRTSEERIARRFGPNVAVAGRRVAAMVIGAAE